MQNKKVGLLLGGAIAPGVEISLDALVSQTAMLRRVEPVEPDSVIGRNTQGVRLIDLRQEGEKVVGATRAPEEREADAAAAVLQEVETPGGEDDDGSPPSGEET